MLPYAPVVLATFWLARMATTAILAKNEGEPGVPLDDSYIHFQYARSLAEGRFFAFVPGEGYTSGATSLLWPAALAPFYLIGFKGASIIWPAWGLGFAFLALLAIETKRLAERLVGEHAAIGAGAAVLCFGGYTWFAASGMEVTPLAWSLAYSARLSCTWAEEPASRTASLRNRLLAMAIAGPLIRPEGMLVSLLVLATLAIFAPEPSSSSNEKRSIAGLAQHQIERAWSLVALVGPAIPPLINRVLTGHFATSTTLVKWLPANPYYGGANLQHGVQNNLAIFQKTLMDGQEWSAVFIPNGARYVCMACLIAIPLSAVRSRLVWRSLVVLAMALAMVLTTTYLSFLWNRLRYLWPFTFAWCIGMACLARIVTDLAATIRPRFAAMSGILTGIGAGMLAHHLPWSIDDVAGSASAITRQQVKLGRWAADHLPDGARVGVSDTGAIAYFSNRKTFDVVGLTTPEEAEYWVAGPGSRYEHYERLHSASATRLPTHFIVYPHWMACDAVLGNELTRATVTDSTILGGQTMIAYEADYSSLHLADRPDLAVPGALVDELDVADLVSEREHAYQAYDQNNNEADDVPVQADTAGPRRFDGGRLRRHWDRFKINLPAGKSSTLVGRFSAAQGATLEVRMSGELVGRLEVSAGGWVESRVELPVTPGGPRDLEIRSNDARLFGSLHYWLYVQ